MIAAAPISRCFEGGIRIQAGVLWRWSVSGCLCRRQKQVTHLKLDCHSQFLQPSKQTRCHVLRVPCPLCFCQRWEFGVTAKYTGSKKHPVCSDVSILPYVVSRRKKKSEPTHISLPCITMKMFFMMLIA